MIKINENNQVNAKDIYAFVEVKTKFSDWIKRCINYADLQKDKDFFAVLSESTGGRPATEYYFTLAAAKEVCIVSQTDKAKELRRWLIGLSEQRENADLLTHEEVIYLTKLKEFFKYVDNQTTVEKKHLKTFVNENKDKRNPFADFHNYRNRILEIEPDKINNAIKEYCLKQQKALPQGKNKRELMNILDNHLTLRNAVWDFLNIKGQINALKLAGLVKKMADTENLVVYRKNEDNLYQVKENITLKQLSE